MASEIKKRDHGSDQAAEPQAPLVGAARRGRKPEGMRVAVAVRRQTDEERRRYDDAVRLFLTEIVREHLGRGGEGNHGR
jgi:hypothetical protein